MNRMLWDSNNNKFYRKQDHIRATTLVLKLKPKNKLTLINNNLSTLEDKISMELRLFFLVQMVSSALETKLLEILSLVLESQATLGRLSIFLRVKCWIKTNSINHNKLAFTKMIWIIEKVDVSSEETVDRRMLELISATLPKSRRKCVLLLPLLESQTPSTSFLTWLELFQLTVWI